MLYVLWLDPDMPDTAPPEELLRFAVDSVRRNPELEWDVMSDAGFAIANNVVLPDTAAHAGRLPLSEQERADFGIPNGTHGLVFMESDVERILTARARVGTFDGSAPASGIRSDLADFDFAAVLETHRPHAWNWSCTCGEMPPATSRTHGRAHRAHLAGVLREAVAPAIS